MRKETDTMLDDIAETEVECMLQYLEEKEKVTKKAKKMVTKQIREEL